MEEIKRQETSVTGSYLLSPPSFKTTFRKPAGAVHIEHADRFNLKDLTVDIPTGCFVSVTGPSGSGKSTLIFEVLAKGNPGMLFFANTEIICPVCGGAQFS